MYNGVWQLQSLWLKYCPKSGSSRGARDLKDMKDFQEWKAQNQQIKVYTNKHADRHPYLVGHYANGMMKQITVKNMNPSEILRKMQYMRDQWGTSPKSFRRRQVPLHRSIQGPWNSRTFVQQQVNVTKEQ